jgi:biopolymer transport protein ExbD
MRRRENFPSKQADVNMTPMMDVVFILLIFFVVTATFLSEYGLDMRSPACEAAECGTARTPVLVQIDGDNQVFVNQVRTNADGVISAVYQHRSEEPDTPVLLVVEYDADHGTVVQILDDMRTLGAPVSVQRAET